jgi:hypothetical protein
LILIKVLITALCCGSTIFKIVVEVSMTGLHGKRTGDPQIDAVGWLYLILAVAIIVTAAVIAYEGTTTELGPVSHLAAR